MNNDEKLIQLLAQRVKMKIKKRGQLFIFTDETGCESIASSTQEVADLLYDEIFCDGYTRGKSETVTAITNHARLL